MNFRNFKNLPNSKKNQKCERRIEEIIYDCIFVSLLHANFLKNRMCEKSTFLSILDITKYELVKTWNTYKKG